MNRTATRPRTGVTARILLAALLVLGMMAPAAAAPRRAWAAETGNLTVGRVINYDSYFTNWFEVDGQSAWCGDPSMATPGSGAYPKQPLSAASGRTAELAADMWFSYGSPGFDASLWPGRWVDGSEMTADRYTALAHILMSDTYSSNGNYAMYGCSDAFREWVGWNVLGFDAHGNVVNEGATGRLIAARTGEVPSSFEPFMLYTGASTQVMLSFTYSTTVKVSKSASESWAQNDPDYSLAGAVYGIYRTQGDAEADENRVATITTGADGSGESESLGATRDTFYAKEVSPSPGYALDPNVYEVTPENGYAFASESRPSPRASCSRRWTPRPARGPRRGTRRSTGPSTRRATIAAARRRRSRGRPWTGRSCSRAFPSARSRSGRCRPPAATCSTGRSTASR